MFDFSQLGTYVISFAHSYGTMTRDDGSPFDYDNVVFHCIVCSGSGRSVVLQKVKTSVCLDIFGVDTYEDLYPLLKEYVGRKVSFTCDNTKARNVLYFEFFDKSIEIVFS